MIEGQGSHETNTAAMANPCGLSGDVGEGVMRCGLSQLHDNKHTRNHKNYGKLYNNFLKGSFDF